MDDIWTVKVRLDSTYILPGQTLNTPPYSNIVSNFVHVTMSKERCKGIQTLYENVFFFTHAKYVVDVFMCFKEFDIISKNFRFECQVTNLIMYSWLIEAMKFYVWFIVRRQLLYIVFVCYRLNGRDCRRFGQHNFVSCLRIYNVLPTCIGFLLGGGRCRQTARQRIDRWGTTIRNCRAVNRPRTHRRELVIWQEIKNICRKSPTETGSTKDLGFHRNRVYYVRIPVIPPNKTF